ncbi:MAG: 3'-5' exonuclease [Planctomycetales bacterium]|nr:3'-5' exonuclease [Planctomycetales bacterium]MBN8625547.1 3'-5' exonuclease [Planctomycetota bacterium]
MKHEAYFSVDIEAAGPIPGKYSLLSVGACLVSDQSQGFYVELKPVSDEFVPEAIAVSGFTLDALKRSGELPTTAFQRFADWIEEACGDRKPVFVGFNASFDWQFINWYFHSYLAKNPFGFGGVDIKSYFMGRRGSTWAESSSSKLPVEFQPDTAQTHNALDDARAQASIFSKMLAEATKCRAKLPFGGVE